MQTNVKATLAVLRNERTRLDAAIKALEDLGKAPETNGNGHPRHKLTIMGAALSHMKKVGEKQTSQQLIEAIRQAGINVAPATFQTMMSRRARKKIDLVHKGRGVWSLR